MNGNKNLENNGSVRNFVLARSHFLAAFCDLVASSLIHQVWPLKFVPFSEDNKSGERTLPHVLKSTKSQVSHEDPETDRYQTLSSIIRTRCWKHFAISSQPSLQKQFVVQHWTFRSKNKRVAKTYVALFRGPKLRNRPNRPFYTPARHWFGKRRCEWRGEQKVVWNDFDPALEVRKRDELRFRVSVRDFNTVGV